MIREMPKEKLKEFYKKHYCRDFPLEERQPYFLFIRLIKKEKQKIYEYCEEEIAKAYFTVTEGKKAILLSYYAVYPEYRGKGTGSHCLEEMKQYFQKPILLECEKIEKAKTEEDKMIRQRRVSFYKKAGFLEIPFKKFELFGIDYHILAYGFENLEPKEGKDLILQIYQKQLPKFLMRKVKIET